MGFLMRIKPQLIVEDNDVFIRIIDMLALTADVSGDGISKKKLIEVLSQQQEYGLEHLKNRKWWQ
jgi:hypothetical protein